QAGGQAGRDIGRRQCFAQIADRQQLIGHRLTDQHTQGVEVLCHLHAVGIDLHGSGVGHGIALMHVDACRALGEVEQRLIGLQGQPGAGDFTDQTQARGLIIGLAGLEARIGRVALTAQATEEVELIGRETR
nr:hypothetical protein [Tanacetum cinerariifolium]